MQTFKKVFPSPISLQRTSQASSLFHLALFWVHGSQLAWLNQFENIFTGPFILITLSLLTWHGRLATAGWHRPEGQEPGGRNYFQCCVSCWDTNAAKPCKPLTLAAAWYVQSEGEQNPVGTQPPCVRPYIRQSIF